MSARYSCYVYWRVWPNAVPRAVYVVRRGMALASQFHHLRWACADEAYRQHAQRPVPSAAVGTTVRQ